MTIVFSILSFKKENYLCFQHVIYCRLKKKMYNK